MFAYATYKVLPDLREFVGSNMMVTSWVHRFMFDLELPLVRHTEFAIVKSVHRTRGCAT
jgi:hypothetical protein